MKKILLINPKFTEEVSIFNIPVSLLYLGSWLTSKGYGVEIIDALHFKSESELRSRVMAWLSEVNYVGFTVMSTQVPHALELSKFIRKFNSRLPIIWGGIHPTLYPEQTIKSEFVDYVVVGDGEYALELICKGYVTGGGTIVGGPVSLENTPSIDWSLVERLQPGTSLEEISKLVEFGMPILTSRSCPYTCTFCINSVLNTKYRRTPIELTIRDIKETLARGISRIEFQDECLLLNKGRLIEILDGIEKENLKFSWVASSRTDFFRDARIGDIKLLKRLRDAGCWFVGAGAESGSQRILDKVNKGTWPEDTLNMAAKLGEVGIGCNFSFMIGLPGETKEDYKATLRLIGELIRVNPNSYILGPQIYRPYPGSKLYDECKEYGMKEPQSLEEWSESPYIHFEFSSKRFFNKKLYPWVQFKGDLTTLVFYATLMGVRPRFKPMTKLLRLIGGIRCRLYFFRFPILKWLYGTLRGSWVENILRRRKVI